MEGKKNISVCILREQIYSKAQRDVCLYIHIHKHRVSQRTSELSRACASNVYDLGKTHILENELKRETCFLSTNSVLSSKPRSYMDFEVIRKSIICSCCFREYHGRNKPGRFRWEMRIRVSFTLKNNIAIEGALDTTGQ